MNIKFAKWNAVEWKFMWYDKEKKEEKELIIEEFPVTRVWFNYSWRHDWKGIWSNEVTNIADEEFVVCNADWCIWRGKYKDLFIDWCELNVVVYGFNPKDSDDEFAIMCRWTWYHSLIKTLANVNIEENMLNFAWVFDAEKEWNKFKVPLFWIWTDIRDLFDFDMVMLEKSKALEEHYANNREKYKNMKPKPKVNEVIDDIDADLEF